MTSSLVDSQTITEWLKAKLLHTGSVRTCLKHVVIKLESHCATLGEPWCNIIGAFLSGQSDRIVIPFGP